MTTLTINNYSIPYEERRSSRYRRITLSILEDRVRISAPVNVSLKQLNDLLASKQEWILKHWLAKQAALKPPAKYIDGEHFSYRGNRIELKLKRHTGKMIRVSLEEQQLFVDLPQDLPQQEVELNIKAALISWYKAQARKFLKERLDRYAKQMQVSYKNFRLKYQKTSWGSCSSKGNINLNWRIIMAPDKGIDYIIIHELAHLTYLNHSKQFWQRVEDYMEDYTVWKLWFKTNGQKLRL
ncbi:M48 family metallopeptidase [Desulfosporosinus hippei]|uniref:YgjP-like metallopeptidase domain-containing protein n=1 Tax=Desulfosporosinus hippei DSM 8344 TaxID=1121419 RepID=A0A1G8FYZ2_9FIRM|nr:SprT family zinc-dependent metalloprotease [Desulfosporosinus hippei]SDH87357.1 hypothetical protein SAMN05443529_1211 [Desulfosporosinus hippei DSM 8344]